MMIEMIKKLLYRLHSNSVYGTLFTNNVTCIAYDSSINLMTIGFIDEKYKDTIENIGIKIIRHADKKIDIQFYIPTYNVDIINNVLYIHKHDRKGYIIIPMNKNIRMLIK